MIKKDKKSVSETNTDIRESPADELNWGNKAIVTLYTCFKYRGETMQKQIVAKNQNILNPLLTLCISVSAATLATFLLLIALGINAFDPFYTNSGMTSQVIPVIISAAGKIFSWSADPTRLFNADIKSLIFASGLGVLTTLALITLATITRIMKAEENKKFKEYMSSYIYESCGAFLTNLIIMILAIGLIMIAIPFLPRLLSYDFIESLMWSILISIAILSGFVVWWKVRSDSEKFWVVIISLFTFFTSLISVIQIFELNIKRKEPFIEARISNICGVDDEKGCLVNFKLRNLEAFEAADKMNATVRFLDIEKNSAPTQDLEFKLRVVSDKVKPLLIREDENIYVQLTPTESGCKNYANAKIKNSNLLIDDISFAISGFALRNQEVYENIYSIKGGFTGWTSMLTQSVERFCKAKISK